MKGFDVSGFLDNLVNTFLLEGVFVTVWLTVVSLAGGLVLGLCIALLRSSRHPALSGFARFYTWVFRGTPLLIQLIVIYAGLPQVGLKLSVTGAALTGLILHEAAYISEIVRGGFMSVAKGQWDAGKALGVPRSLTLFMIILPQAFRTMLPALGNQVNGLLKATSITSVISMEELMRNSETLMQVKFDVLEVYMAAAVYYLALTTLWDALQRLMERRMERPYRNTHVETDSAVPERTPKAINVAAEGGAA